MLFVYGGCCLYFALYCAAAAACTFDPRMPVLPVLRFLLSYGCCLNRIRCCMAATASAYGCAAVFVCCAAGGLWRRVSCGMVWRRECEDALRRCGSLPCFCTLSSFFALFLTFCFIPRLIFPSLPSALAFARSLASPPFFSPLSLSSRSFLSSRYLCALFLADGFLPLTS